jgi:pyruvate formate lyase activating enzyme
MNWKENSRVAMHWHTNEQGNKIVCDLCPRHCQTQAGQMGFCKVRGNVDGTFHTFNFGKSVTATQECIETEAVNHFMPGARILSLGNIGCMMACSYCQNWQTSQIKHLNDANVFEYTPEQVIELAVSNDIKVISWTYNDPVVWHEFVLETSKLAKAAGLTTLYKSALYIELEPLRELIEVIDIFSISLKCMDDAIYRKENKGKLQPVLDAIELIAASDRHLEISQLVVTGLNDDGTDAIKTARWMREKLKPEVPLHLVAYHPSFKYKKPRTELATLLKLRELVLNEGLEYVYLGNVYADDMSNTYCKSCSHLLVERFGLSVQVPGLDAHGNCKNCQTPSVIRDALGGQPSEKPVLTPFIAEQTYAFEWNEEIRSVHIFLERPQKDTVRIQLKRMPSNTVQYLEFNEGLERIILSKSSAEETQLIIETACQTPLHILPVLDRAHFPVIDETKASSYA